jgi:hypothetical protein
VVGARSRVDSLMTVGAGEVSVDGAGRLGGVNVQGNARPMALHREALVRVTVQAGLVPVPGAGHPGKHDNRQDGPEEPGGPGEPDD